MVQTGLFFVSGLARVEVPAALWRKCRAGELSARDARTLAARFSADFHGTPSEQPRFIAVAVVPRILDSAAELTERHGLRAYDAVQLSNLPARWPSGPSRQYAARSRALTVGRAQLQDPEGFNVHPDD